MCTNFIDLRFQFQRNPFNSEQINIPSNQQNSLQILKKYLLDHYEDFTVVNPITSIKYIKCVAANDIKTLCGCKSPAKYEALDDFKFLSDHVKKCLIVSGMQLSPAFKEWMEDFDMSDVHTPTVEQPSVTSTEQVSTTDANTDSQTIEQPVEFLHFLDDDSTKEYQKCVGIGVNYDSANDRKISYDDVCKMCLSIASSYHNNENIKDPSIIAIENKRRIDLINKIAKFRRHREIQAVCSDDDISKISIERLEALSAEIDSKFGQLKLKEVSRQALTTCSELYDMVLPHGIPIGNGRHVSFNGVGDEIIKEMYTSTSTVGLAFDNIIQKHNIKISDEMSVLMALGTILVKNIRITSDKPQTTDDASTDIENEEEEELVDM